VTLRDIADVSVPEQRERLSRWVARRAGAPAVLRETHVSILAFTEDRVWKCKKAVRFPFVDLSTAALRLRNCEREVALNRRLAPDVYLGVVPLQDDVGAVVDHLVEMRRLPDESRLASIAGRDTTAGGSCVDATADLLAGFHERARAGADIDRSATPRAVRDLWEENLREVAGFAGRVLDPGLLERVGTDARRYVAGRGALLADRIARGRIRDGHGDLLADDIFCLSDGPRVLDCLEFDDHLRYGDVLGDLAFLAMDLERLGRRDLAERLLDRYRQKSGDRWPASLEHFYVAYRALVRAKVACLRVSDDPAAANAAHELLALSAAHLEQARVQLVLIGGPPATGKTTLSAALACATGWPVLHSDDVRKQLAGIAPTSAAPAPLDRGLYSKSWDDRTYGALLERAREQLEHGNSVILDASWSSSDHRSRAEALAAGTASDLSAFRCDVAPAIADARATTRSSIGRDASDAGPTITAELRARFDPWPGAEVVETTQPPDILVRLTLRRLQRAATRT